MEGILLIRIGIGGLWNLLGGIAQSLTLGDLYGDGSSGGRPAARWAGANGSLDPPQADLDGRRMSKGRALVMKNPDY